MKRITQIICLVLVLSLTLTLPAAAAEISPWASSYFMSHSCYLWKISSTEFQVWFDVRAVATMDKLGASEIIVEKSSDGVNWEPMQTYSMSNYSGMTYLNTVGHSGCVTYDEATSGFYRAQVTFYAKRGNGTAEYTDYTDTITMP